MLPVALFLTYGDAYATALRDQKPLVVFVGVPALPVEGAVACSQAKLPWHTSPGVLVARPRGDYFEWLATLPPTASAADVQRELDKTKPMPLPAYRPVFRPVIGPPSFGGC